LGFGFWSVFEGGSAEKEKSFKFGPIITISIAFFIGELGDKTQFATIALSSQAQYPLIILVGTVSAMMASSMLGIFAGIKLGEKVPDFYMKIGSAFLFVSYGLIKLSDSSISTMENERLFIALLSFIVIGFIVILWIRIALYMATSETTYQKVARNLKAYYNKMELSIQTICLGEDVCGVCMDKQCLIGHTKYLLEEAKKGHKADIWYLKSPIVKQVQPQKVEDALRLTIEELKDHWTETGYKHIHHIRENLERILFQSVIVAANYTEYMMMLDRNLKDMEIDKTKR